jgi:hypothetical protein
MRLEREGTGPATGSYTWTSTACWFCCGPGQPEGRIRRTGRPCQDDPARPVLCHRSRVCEVHHVERDRRGQEQLRVSRAGQRGVRVREHERTHRRRSSSRGAERRGRGFWRPPRQPAPPRPSGPPGDCGGDTTPATGRTWRCSRRSAATSRDGRRSRSWRLESRKLRNRSDATARRRGAAAFDAAPRCLSEEDSAMGCPCPGSRRS